MPSMRFWFAHNSAVTLREQVFTQIVLAILSDDLLPGQRLPSTRELARRFRLHPNTVSAGYRQLDREGWVEFRRGSGVYVRSSKPEKAVPPASALDQLVAELLRSARRLGIPLATVRSRLHRWFSLPPPDHFLLIERDEELRRILAAEMREALKLPVKSCGLPSSRSVKQIFREFARELERAIPVTLAGKEKSVRQELPAGADLLTLRVRSVPASLAGWLPAPAGVLVGVASRWPGFLKSARTMLIAAGFPPDSLLFRDARKANWRRGLKSVAAVVCDAVTAAELPRACRAVAFTLVSESSLRELQHWEEFIGGPLARRLEPRL
ncbi:MAG: GntR family transcriptional regulator [Candidatus Acidiferrales bacterium]